MDKIQEFEFYMRRCLELANLGLGNVQPNPLVGTVIVHDYRIIGEGYHIKFGGAHAEVNAINAVKDKDKLKDSTLYVNLEPCSHHGKTPPCTDLILQTGIPRIVIGNVDSYYEVAGKGISKLRNAGCEVEVGILSGECREINRRFFTFYEEKRPYIILKWAQTNDGFIDMIRDHSNPLQPTWITSETSRILVHKWRSEEDAIAIGRVTAEMDNPRLDNRSWKKKSPVRILVDRELKISKKHHIYDDICKTLIINEKISEITGNTKLVKLNFDSDFLQSFMNLLYNSDIQSVIIEGGAFLINSFIETNNWDEARVFIGDVNFGNGIMAPQIDKKPVASERLFSANLLYFRNRY
ncbi:bifunctional diaminohydroxyphosphoribosylaminopyrimidine deaminase/5-amino-6-(5-phosphoribosylamino)uracil reductase RibD [Bacteroidota bacterium]